MFRRRCCEPVVVTVDQTQILSILDRLESLMATAAEQIDAMTLKLDDLAGDLRALVAALNAERENLTPAGQAALDAANAKIDALDAEVGEHDGQPPLPPEPVF